METIIVILIIIAVAGLLGRSFYHSLTRRDTDCSCGLKECPGMEICGISRTMEFLKQYEA